MRPRTRSHMPILLSVMGMALAACVTTGTPQYELISRENVSGVSLDMVRRSQVDAEGNVVGSPDYGIMDSEQTFHPCGQAPCSDADFLRVAASTSGKAEAGGGGGGGGGGM